LKKILSAILVLLLVLGLVSVRYWETTLFYDPLLVFFEGAYLNATRLPKLDFFSLLLNISLRYWLNSALSILTLVVLFPRKGIFKISLLLYVALFVLLIIGFSVIVMTYDQHLSMLLFYVRRFLIQPIFLLVLVPAFYYHHVLSKA